MAIYLVVVEGNPSHRRDDEATIAMTMTFDSRTILDKRDSKGRKHTYCPARSSELRGSTQTFHGLPQPILFTIGNDLVSIAPA